LEPHSTDEFRTFELHCRIMTKEARTDSERDEWVAWQPRELARLCPRPGEFYTCLIVEVTRQFDLSLSRTSCGISLNGFEPHRGRGIEAELSEPPRDCLSRPLQSHCQALQTHPFSYSVFQCLILLWYPYRHYGRTSYKKRGRLMVLSSALESSRSVQGRSAVTLSSTA
jgi:hypothetical protein